MDIEFLKDRYDFELDRKDKLTSALTLPVGVLTGLGGLLGAMARSFSYSTPRITWAFVALLAAAVVAFITCLVLLARAYHAQTYEYLPLLADLDVAEDEYHEFNAYVSNTGGEIEETFDSNLRSRIIKAADANTRSNDRRSKWMHYSRIALFWVLVLSALSVVPYLADQVQNRNSRVVAPEAPKPIPTAQTPAAPTGGSQAAPQRPTFPANRVIREGQEPTNNRIVPNEGDKK